MIQVTITEAKAHLSRLIRLVQDGEEVVITRRKQPIVMLIALPEARSQRRIGGASDVVLSIAPDFDAPLSDMTDYM